MNRAVPTLIQHDDETVNRIQRGALDALAYLFGLPTSRAQVLRTGVKLVATDTLVSHGIGQPLQGWVVVRNNANAVVFEVTVSPDPKTTVFLRASAPCTVSLLFF